MNRYLRPVVLTTVALSALSLASPALAQRGHGGGKGSAPPAQSSDRRGGGQDQQGDARARGGAVQAPARQEAQRQSAPAQAPRQQVQPQAQPQRQVQAQRQVEPQRQLQSQVQQAPRQQAQAPRGTAVPRSNGPAQRGYNAPPPQQRYSAPSYQPRYDNSYRGSNYYPARPYVARRPVFVQPYYAFRPRFTLSFGIHVGYGISYPWSYWDPYASYNYGLSVGPGYSTRNYYDRVGGLSFDLDPWDASVFVDNHYVGVAADFGPNQMPLTMSTGRHRIDLRCEGFRSVSFDINVMAGQVIPYQGSLAYN